MKHDPIAVTGSHLNNVIQVRNKRNIGQHVLIERDSQSANTKILGRGVAELSDMVPQEFTSGVMGERITHIGTPPNTALLSFTSNDSMRGGPSIEDGAQNVGADKWTKATNQREPLKPLELLNVIQLKFIKLMSKSKRFQPAT